MSIAEKKPERVPSQMGLLGRFLLECREKDRVAEDCFVNEFFDRLRQDGRVNGMDGIVDFAADTHRIAKQSQSVPTRMNWVKALLELAKENERMRLEQMNQFTDEELHARMVVAVIEEIQNNPSFATVMMIEAVKSLRNMPDFAQRIDDLTALMSTMKGGDFSAANQEVNALLYESEQQSAELDEEPSEP